MSRKFYVRRLREEKVDGGAISVYRLVWFIAGIGIVAKTGHWGSVPMSEAQAAQKAAGFWDGIGTKRYAMDAEDFLAVRETVLGVDWAEVDSMRKLGIEWVGHAPISARAREMVRRAFVYDVPLVPSAAAQRGHDHVLALAGL